MVRQPISKKMSRRLLGYQETLQFSCEGSNRQIKVPRIFMILVDDWLFTIFWGSLPFVRANQHSFSLGGGGIYDCWNQSEISIIWGLGVFMPARANQHSL